jgi:hypothetical protein
MSNRQEAYDINAGREARGVAAEARQTGRDNNVPGFVKGDNKDYGAASRIVHADRGTADQHVAAAHNLLSKAESGAKK